jgi:TrmH family RNA methyltransferase
MNELFKASQKQLAHVRSLGKRRHRREFGQFIAEGHRTVQQIITQKKLSVKEIFITQEYLHEFGKPSKNESVFLVSAKDLQGITDTETQQGICAVCEIPPPVELSFWNKPEGFLLAFDHIQDPGNVGTLIRTAAWFGCEGIICSEGTVDQWNPKLVRSTVGATGYLPYIEGALVEVLDQLQDYGWQIMLLDAGDQSISLVDWHPQLGTVLVIGNEANGIDTQLLKKYPKLRVDGVKNQSAAESLNAAIAGAIAMQYTFMRFKR